MHKVTSPSGIVTKGKMKALREKARIAAAAVPQPPPERF
jgi:hypothetical protein